MRSIRKMTPQESKISIDYRVYRYERGMSYKCINTIPNASLILIIIAGLTEKISVQEKIIRALLAISQVIKNNAA